MTTFELKVEPKNYVKLTKKSGESELVFGSFSYHLELRFTKYEDLEIYSCWVCVNNAYLMNIGDIKYFEVMGVEND